MSMNCMEAMDCARGVESGAGEVAVLGLCVGRYVQSASVDITELKSPPTKCSISGAVSTHCTMS